MGEEGFNVYGKLPHSSLIPGKLLHSKRLQSQLSRANFAANYQRANRLRKTIP